MGVSFKQLIRTQNERTATITHNTVQTQNTTADTASAATGDEPSFAKPDGVSANVY